jgi:hypothetical protein
MSGQEEVGPGCPFGRTVWRGAAFDRCSEPELITQIGIVQPRRFFSRRLPGTSHGVFHLVAGPVGSNRRRWIVSASGPFAGAACKAHAHAANAGFQKFACKRVRVKAAPLQTVCLTPGFIPQRCQTKPLSPQRFLPKFRLPVLAFR